MRIFWHFVDLTVNNAWLLYREINEKRNENKSMTNLLQFRSNIARSLIFSNRNENLKRGRPKSSPCSELQPNKKRTHQNLEVTRSVPYDNQNRYPDHTQKKYADKCHYCLEQMKKKIITKVGKSRVICKKCKVALCLKCYHKK